MSLPVVAIIGRPNVGKSRLFNRLVGKKQAIVSDVAGTTRDRVYAKIENMPIPFLLMDTGGLEFDEQEGPIENDIQTQARIAIQEADIIVFVTEVKNLPLSQDYEVAEFLRKSGTLNEKSVIFVLSKCDNEVSEDVFSEYYSLGIGKPYPISAIHNRGIKTFLDKVQLELKNIGYSKQEKKLEEIHPEEIPRIAFVGRPNVGKSSLINAYLSEERLIVSDIQGTTRDATDTEIKWEKKPFIFVDTAGIRKRGKIEQGIEKWAITRSWQSLERADVACLIIDAEEGIVSQDQHVIEQILAAKTGLVIIVNKWDTREKGEEERNAFIWKLQEKFPFLSWAPVLFVSAKNKQNIVKLFPLIEGIVEERKKRIPTGKINAFIREIVAKHHPTGTKRIRPKIFYMTQVDTQPPKFKLFVNKQEYFHFSYFRYLENKLREIFGFQGTVIDIDIVDRESIYQK